MDYIPEGWPLLSVMVMVTQILKWNDHEVICIVTMGRSDRFNIGLTRNVKVDSDRAEE